MSSELENRLEASETAIAALQLENLNLSADLNRLRAADVPNLLYSIELVIKLHALVIHGPCTPPADIRLQTSSPPSPPQHSAESSRSGDWRSPTSHECSCDPLAELCLERPSEDSSNMWVLSPWPEAD